MTCFDMIFVYRHFELTFVEVFDVSFVGIKIHMIKLSVCDTFIGNRVWRALKVTQITTLFLNEPVYKLTYPRHVKK